MTSKLIQLKVLIVFRSGEEYILNKNENIRWSRYSVVIINEKTGHERHYPTESISFVDYGRKV